MTTLDAQWNAGNGPKFASALPVPGGQTLDPQVIDATFVDENGDLVVGGDRPDPIDIGPITPDAPPPGAGNTTTMLLLGAAAIGGIWLLTRRR